MKTTLIIPDPLFRALKKRAVESGETLSNLVADFIRRGLREREKPEELPPLPSFDMGKALVDITDREALYRAMDEERDARLYALRSDD